MPNLNEKYLKFYRLFYETVMSSEIFCFPRFQQDMIIGVMILNLEHSKEKDKKWLIEECKRWYKEITTKEWPNSQRVIFKNLQKSIQKEQKEEKEYIKSRAGQLQERLKINRKIRFKIFKRDGFICHYCGRKPPQVILQIDHKIPISKGGKSIESNMITACRDCNIGKKHHSL